MYEYNVQVLHVVDADTMRIRADLGFSCYTECNIRLNRINAYEVTTARGIVARSYIINLLTAALEIRIVSKHQEKYGRWLAEMNVRLKDAPEVWVNLNDNLVLQSHAIYKDYN